jgi:hypothetical protein
VWRYKAAVSRISSTSMKKILIVEDHPDIREMLRRGRRGEAVSRLGRKDCSENPAAKDLTALPDACRRSDARHQLTQEFFCHVVGAPSTLRSSSTSVGLFSCDRRTRNEIRRIRFWFHSSVAGIDRRRRPRGRCRRPRLGERRVSIPAVSVRDILHKVLLLLLSPPRRLCEKFYVLAQGESRQFGCGFFQLTQPKLL